MTTLAHILAGTPRWVFAVLLLLLAVGLRQLRDRQVTPLRLIAMPVTMAVLSVHGLTADFGVRPLLLVVWGASASIVLYAMVQRTPPAAAGFDTLTGLVTVPGSALPLLLMLALFSLKYAVGVALAMQPALREALPWTLLGAALYGVFTALFAGRALRLGWLALRTREDRRSARVPTL